MGYIDNIFYKILVPAAHRRQADSMEVKHDVICDWIPTVAQEEAIQLIYVFMARLSICPGSKGPSQDY